MDLWFPAFNAQQHAPLRSGGTEASCFSVAVPAVGASAGDAPGHVILQLDTDIEAFINNASIYSLLH